MIRPLLLSTFGILWMATAAGAQPDKEIVRPVLVRALLHDPLHPSAELYYLGQDRQVAAVNLRPQALGQAMAIVPINGSLVFFDKADIDIEKPSASVAAACKLPAGIRRAIVVITPAPAGSETAYRFLIIDDSENGFANGESLVLPLINSKVAVQAGEHNVPVVPGKLTRIPRVTAVNEFNMAQTNFHYEQDGSWVTFAERQLQYIDACRRLFIIHITPGALSPTVTTIVDTQIPKAAPQAQ